VSKKTKIQMDRLAELESTFDALLPSCLVQCVRGRWGLFGQNTAIDPDDRYWTWPEARRLREIAAEIQSLRREIGFADNSLCNQFLRLLTVAGAHVPGEPKLAAMLLDKVGSG
jgi:hypothetical protein